MPHKTNYGDDEAGVADWIVMPLADPHYGHKVGGQVSNHIDAITLVFTVEGFRQLKTAKRT